MNDRLIQKELWRKRWLSSINELSSIEIQQKSWIDELNTNPHWSFVEFMCSYFDDLGIDNNYKYQLENKFISKNEFDIISPWHILLNSYNSPTNDDYDVKSILQDEKWQTIVEKGRIIKGQLSQFLSENENQILNEEVDYTNYK